MQHWSFSLIEQKLSKLRGSELRRIWDILRYLYSTLSAARWYEAFVLGFWNFTQCKNIYCECATSRFQFDRPKNVGIMGVWTQTNLRYFGIFIQHRAIMRISWRCAVYVVWTNMCNGVRKTLWERLWEKDIVRKTLWERLCKKVAVRKIFHLTFFLIDKYSW